MSHVQVQNPDVNIAHDDVEVHAMSKQRAEDVHDKIMQIKEGKIRELLTRQADLLDRIEKLSELPDMRERERQKAILEAELKKVMAELAKRRENIAVLAAELFALYDELGIQVRKAKEESPEDKAKRREAQQRYEEAVARLAEAKQALADAENSFELFGLFGKEKKIKKAKENVADAEASVENAKRYLAEVEEQIKIDQADRMRKASLGESFAIIRQLTEDATRILKEDIQETAERIGITEKALNSALARKAEVARALDRVRDEIVKLERDLEREQSALDEIPDKGSAAYAQQQQVVAGIEQKLTKKKGEELKLNAQHMALVQAIEGNRSSLMGLQVQRDTAEVYLAKLQTAEKTARVIGENIARMEKNTLQEAASDALDKATDQMLATAVELGVQAEAASAKIRNAALERHEKLMHTLRDIRETGDKAMAEEARRYLELDERIRAGYKERGIDVDSMSNLQQAAEEMVREFSEPSSAEVEY